MIAAAFPAIAGVYLLASLLVLAPRKPGYSHARHTISELGEIGAPDQRIVALRVFLPVGLLLLLAASLVRTASPATAALALCIGIGYIVAAAFPCDPGSPLFGSTRQVVHNLGGAVEYSGGGFALLAIAESLGQPFKTAGFVVLVSVIALTVLPSASIRGIIQRVAEACLFSGLTLAMWQLSS